MKKILLVSFFFSFTCVFALEPSPTGLVRCPGTVKSDRSLGEGIGISDKDFEELLAGMSLETQEEKKEKETSISARGKDGEPAKKKRRVAATAEVGVTQEAPQNRGVKRGLEEVQEDASFDPDPQGARDSMAQRYDDGEPLPKKARIMSSEALGREEQEDEPVQEPARKKFRKSDA